MSGSKGEGEGTDIIHQLKRTPERSTLIKSWKGKNYKYIEDLPIDIYDLYDSLYKTKQTQLYAKTIIQLLKEFPFNPKNPVFADYDLINTQNLNNGPFQYLVRDKILRDIVLEFWNYSTEDDLYYETKDLQGYYYLPVKEHIPKFIKHLLVVMALINCSHEEYFVTIDPNNTIISKLPFQKNAAFKEIFRELEKLADNYYNEYITKDMHESVKNVNLYFAGRKTPFHPTVKKLGYEVDKWLKHLPEVHQQAIFLQDTPNIKYYNWDKTMLDKEDCYGMTPIAYAVLFNNVNMVRYLLNASAMPNSTRGKIRIELSTKVPFTKDGISLYDTARLLGHTEILNLIETKEDQMKRWRSNTIVGYHQTNDEVANIIQNTPMHEFHFLAGSGGMYGSGIYFAETPEETYYKARARGTILEANVLLGHPLELKTFQDRTMFQESYSVDKIDADTLYYKLLKNGYDSVIARKDDPKVSNFMQSGTEYMVYSPEQAEFIKFVPQPQPQTQTGGSASKIFNKKEYLNNPWILHVKRGRVDLLKILNESQFSQRWILDTTPLMIACARGRLSVVKWLVENKKVDVNATDSMKRNALFYAMQRGYSKTIEYLIHKTPTDLLQKDTDGEFAIEQLSIYPTTEDYRKILLDKLYTQQEKVPFDDLISAITRFYNKTGRLQDIKEHERYKRLLETYISQSHARMSTRGRTRSLFRRTLHKPRMQSQF